MLTFYVSSPVSLARLQSTVCRPYLDGYTDWLAGRGYRPSLIRLYLFGIIPLGRWLEAHNLEVQDFDPHALERFRNERAAAGQWRHTSGKIKAAFLGAQRFHEYLAALGVVAARSDPAAHVHPLQLDFERWMSLHRGLGERTLRDYARYVSALLERLGDDVTRYDPAGLRRFVLDVGERSGRRSATAASTAVRAFLRFLIVTGQCQSALLGAIPRMANWRLAALPSTLPAADVERLIASCAERPLTARRDRAVLLLLWRLALRAGDVAALELADIGWREGRIRVAGKNRRAIWLPLAQDVGDAMVDYLRNERPDVAIPRVFLKSIAPVGALHSRVVSWVVRRAIERSGIEAPAGGAHLLRRSAASEMLRHGATLEQIGAVLRHENLQTTQLYAKVDEELLLGVAPPWPSTARGQEPSVVDRADPPAAFSGSPRPGTC